MLKALGAIFLVWVLAYFGIAQAFLYFLITVLNLAR